MIEYVLLIAAARKKDADIAILLGVTTLAFIFIYFGKKHELERWEGFTFVALYVAYLAFLFLRG